MDQRDPGTLPAEYFEEATVSTRAIAAICMAAILVLVAGLSFLEPSDRVEQTTSMPSPTVRTTLPPVGTTGTAPR